MTKLSGKSLPTVLDYTAKGKLEFTEGYETELVHESSVVSHGTGNVLPGSIAIANGLYPNSTTAQYNWTQNKLWGYRGPKKEPEVLVINSSFTPRKKVFNPLMEVKTHQSMGSSGIAHYAVSGNYYTDNRMLSVMRAFLPSLHKPDRNSPAAMSNRPRFTFGYLLENYNQEILRALDRQHSFYYFNKLEKTRSANVGATIAELDEFMKLGLQIFEGFCNVIRPLTTIGRKGPPTYKEAVQILTSVSGAWLTWSFGVKPIVESLKDLLETLENDALSPVAGQTETPRVLEVKAGGKWGDKGSKSIVTYTDSLYAKPAEDDGVNWTKHPDPASQFLKRKTSSTPVAERIVRIAIDGEVVREDARVTDYPLQYRFDGKVITETKGLYYFKVSKDYLYTVFGLNSLAPMLHEATKFSFIVDWFYKFGDMLTNISAHDGLELYQTCVTSHYTYIGSDTVGNKCSALVKIRAPRKHELGLSIALWDGPAQTYFTSQPAIWETIPDFYLEPGAMVSKFNERAANASALLVLLTDALTKLRNIDYSRMTAKEKYLFQKKMVQLLTRG